MSGSKKPPRVEELESRAVPSTIPFLPTGASGMLGAHAQGNHAPVLAGVLTGSYTPTPRVPDAGLHYNLRNTTHTEPLLREAGAQENTQSVTPAMAATTARVPDSPLRSTAAPLVHHAIADGFDPFTTLRSDEL